jgi:hypothetical protein
MGSTFDIRHFTCSDHGREVRCPYLDEAVTAYLRMLPLPVLCDLRLPPGIGDKRLLRFAGRILGLGQSTLLVKVRKLPVPRLQYQ